MLGWSALRWPLLYVLAEFVFRRPIIREEKTLFGQVDSYAISMDEFNDPASNYRIGLFLRHVLIHQIPCCPRRVLPACELLFRSR